MKRITILLTVAMATAAASTKAVQAQAAHCSGRVELADMDIGCGNEASRTISLATCDFRTGKQPSVQLYNVIDGQSGNVSVSIDQTQAGSFNVTIRPQPSWENQNICKVWRFDWEAQ